MKFLKPHNFFLSLTSFCLLSGCQTPPANTNQLTNINQTLNTANSSADATRDDPEAFGKIVKLPFQPEEVTWRETGEKKIIAVLKFSSADSQNLILQIENQKPVQAAELNAETWFPPELIAKSQQSGNETLKGKQYAADNFFMPPYNRGKITRIDDTNYFILELSAG